MDDASCPWYQSLVLPVQKLYFGRVIAPSDADDTNAAYFPNTPVG
jgi:hypothetical protein